MTTLYDIHQPIFQSAFEGASSFSDYIRSGSETEQKRWKASYEAVTLEPAQISLIESFIRKMNILVLSGTWCGDCVRQGPILQMIGEQSSVIDLRFIDNRADMKLSDELRIHGASRVPVVLVLSEDFYEVARLGDRTLSTYRRKVQNETGAACDAGLGGGDREEVQEWVEFVERAQWLLRTSGLLRSRYGD